MKTDPSKGVIRAWARLLKAHRVALADVEQSLKAAELPPLAWYDVLLELERAGAKGLRPLELEREMLLAQYNLSRLLSRIEQAGYLERRPCDDDGRGQIVVITPAGKTMRRRMWSVYGAAIEATIGSRLSEKEADAVGLILGKLVRPARGDRG